MSVENQIRIAFDNLDNAQWTAGIHYLKNLFVAIRAVDVSAQLDIVVLQSEGTNQAIPQELAKYARPLSIPTELRRDSETRKLVGLLRRFGVIQEPEPRISVFLRKQGIDIVFAQVDFGPQFQIPLLAWIPDFQHMHLPAMFSASEIEGRNWNFSRIANHATCVIVSSGNARDDFVRFAPAKSSKVRVLPFVADVPAETWNSDPLSVCDYYHVPSRFIYLPNQFWMHKNHTLVLKALAAIKSRYPDALVLCTGNTNDYRNPAYFPELLAEISRCGLRENMVILGMVPRQHLFQLMRQSLVVLQPSLFEGWSSTVEEAKSIGKRLLLSDIPVHREQAPAGTVFFHPHDPQSLGECLLEVFKTGTAGPDHEMERAAQTELPRRIREFGQRFISIVGEVTATSPETGSTISPIALAN